MPLPYETSRFDKNEREYLGHTLARQIFGAIYSAIQYRMESRGLTRSEFGDRMGRDKTGASKLLKGPGNWTIQTISDAANALDLDVEFAFFDRHEPTRMFTGTGMHSALSPSQNYYVPGVYGTGTGYVGFGGATTVLGSAVTGLGGVTMGHNVTLGANALVVPLSFFPKLAVINASGAPTPTRVVGGAGLSVVSNG